MYQWSDDDSRQYFWQLL